MRADQVKIGEVYEANVSGNAVPVKVLREIDRGICGVDRYSGRSWSLPRKGWEAKNLKTGRTIFIKSAQRLRPHWNWGNVPMNG